ncbi:MAG: Maf family protein [Promethearchaeota archaeon]
MKNIVLASRSIDRRELLKRARIPFEILITNVDEDKYKKETSNPIELVKQLANAKVLKAKKKLAQINRDAIIIGADTIVELNGEIIGKANNEEHAFRILRQLAGKSHNLITGIAITETYNPKIILSSESTSVKFLDLTDKEIWGYIKTGEWQGRAGAYSIREKASLFIESIQGSSSNVIGLPMNKVYQILRDEFNQFLL